MHRDDGVPYLVDPADHLVVGAVGEVLALDVEGPPPLAVVVAVEAHVEPETEMDSGVTEGAHRHRPF